MALRVPWYVPGSLSFTMFSALQHAAVGRLAALRTQVHGFGSTVARATREESSDGDVMVSTSWNQRCECEQSLPDVDRSMTEPKTAVAMKEARATSLRGKNIIKQNTNISGFSVGESLNNCAWSFYTFMMLPRWLQRSVLYGG